MKSPYYFRFIKINATIEDYVSANQKPLSWFDSVQLIAELHVRASGAP